MEVRNLKLLYFPDQVKCWHSVKSADIPAIGTLIWASHEKLTPDPPIALTFEFPFFRFVNYKDIDQDLQKSQWEPLRKKL